MSLQHTSISAIPHSQDYSTAIEVMPNLPPTTYLTNAESPGRLIGYYDGQSGSVLLYIAGPTGRRWLPISMTP